MSKKRPPEAPPPSSGIGLFLAADEDANGRRRGVVVTGLLRGGAAEACGGIKVGDRLVAVEDERVDDKPPQEVISLITHPERCRQRRRISSSSFSTSLFLTFERVQDPLRGVACEFSVELPRGGGRDREPLLTQVTSAREQLQGVMGTRSAEGSRMPAEMMSEEKGEKTREKEEEGDRLRQALKAAREEKQASEQTLASLRYAMQSLTGRAAEQQAASDAMVSETRPTMVGDLEQEKRGKRRSRRRGGAWRLKSEALAVQVAAEEPGGRPCGSDVSTEGSS
eukprot:763513-Hanusia_phi.AAC.3